VLATQNLKYEETIARVLDDLAGWWVRAEVCEDEDEAQPFAAFEGELTPALEASGSRDSETLAVSVGEARLRFDRHRFRRAQWISQAGAERSQSGDSLTIYLSGVRVRYTLAPPDLPAT
jgi:hypothetical protein